MPSSSAAREASSSSSWSQLLASPRTSPHPQQRGRILEDDRLRSEGSGRHQVLSRCSLSPALGTRADHAGVRNLRSADGAFQELALAPLALDERDGRRWQSYGQREAGNPAPEPRSAMRDASEPQQGPTPPANPRGARRPPGPDPVPRWCVLVALRARRGEPQRLRSACRRVRRGKRRAEIDAHPPCAAKKSAYLLRISRTLSATWASISSVRTDSTTGRTSSAQRRPARHPLVVATARMLIRAVKPCPWERPLKPPEQCLVTHVHAQRDLRLLAVATKVTLAYEDPGEQTPLYVSQLGMRLLGHPQTVSPSRKT